MLIDLVAAGFDVETDIVYATDRNVTGRAIYARPRCLLHPDTAVLLARAIDLARPLGYRLKIYDAFRPAEAQWRLWDFCPDDNYIADPRRGSPHSMGAAVDLTLVDRESGAELDMGTAFDDFRPLAWHANTEVSPAAQRNRLLLLGLMSAAGFDFYSREWWHYQLFKPRGRYPVLSDSTISPGMMRSTP